MADTLRCACRQKVVFRGGVAAILRTDGIVHRLSHCVPDLELELVEVLRRIVEGWREKGVYIADPETGAPRHAPGCTCTACAALSILARAEIGGRCVVCGCVETAACQPHGCSWTSEAKVCCDNHPIDTIVEAEKLFGKKVVGVGHG